MRRKLSVESLENRDLMAGNVIAHIRAGDLVLTGDYKSNHIAIYAGTAPGEIIVAGGKAASNAPDATRVNNALKPVKLTGFTGDIRGSLGAGSDSVYISSEIVKDVTLNMGDGNDFVAVGSVYSPFVLNDGQRFVNLGSSSVGNLSLQGGNGNDRLAIENATVQGNVSLYGNAGDDAFSAVNLTMTGDLFFDGDSGNDLLAITLSSGDQGIDGNVRVKFGAGDDHVQLDTVDIGGDFDLSDKWAQVFSVYDLFHVNVGGDVSLVTSNKNDRLQLNDLSAKRLFVDTQGGDDVVTLLPAFTTATIESIDIRTGAGNDLVSISSMIGKNAVVDTGDGNDNLYLFNAITYDSFTAHLGSGDDSVIAYYADFPGAYTLLDGGSGSDLFTASVPTGKNVVRQNFEN